MLDGRQLSDLLERIALAPSMLFPHGFHFAVESLGANGFLVQLRYQRPDTNTGEMSEGESRWERVGLGASDDSVLKTGFVLMKSIADHELMEAFLVDGIRVFDPHQTIAQLQAGKAAVFSVSDVPPTGGQRSGTWETVAPMLYASRTADQLLDPTPNPPLETTPEDTDAVHS